MTAKEKIDALRQEMKKENMAAYYVPTDDFHGSEYVSDHFKCREYLSGYREFCRSVDGRKIFHPGKGTAERFGYRIDENGGAGRSYRRGIFDKRLKAGGQAGL